MKQVGDRIELKNSGYFKQLLAALLIFGQITAIGPVDGMEIKKVDTAKLPDDGGEKYNRLIFEKSPYLLQHAENPIDWYPWGEEAFARAVRENKPIFLSIGYSTCHWCHVMAGEAFTSAEVAEIINRHFIAIKVDREERPDIDAIYMKVCQILTGRGGWPLTVFLTPDRQPFFAGTYFPVESAYGRPGLVDVLESTVELWKSDRAKIAGNAAKITALINNERSVERDVDKIDAEILGKLFKQLAGQYDQQYGGFGESPKFPSPHQLMFLLRYWQRSGDQAALEMVKKTLTAFRFGGIYDQLGGGFHRYSTDRKFLVPHFEKMLYDQALLAIAYLETYQATGEELFAETAREIFKYVARDLTAPAGGFYSAEDADSEGVEGKFYLWSSAEIDAILGPEQGREFRRVFQVSGDGNYFDELTGRNTGLNILHLREDKTGLLKKEKQLLFEKRQKRIRPFRDDKIITSWNGLMIAALAMGADVLADKKYLEAAERAAGFVLDKLRDDKGRLLRRYRDGEAALPAYLDDYAFLVYGLIQLYEASFKPSYLALAVELNNQMIEIFRDGDHAILNFSGQGNEELLAVNQDLYDGALPAGNSVALINILKLARITDDRQLQTRAEKMAGAIMAEAEGYLPGYTMFMNGVDFMIGPTGEIVIAGEPDSEATRAMKRVISRTFSPNKVLLLHPPGPAGKAIEKIAPYSKYQQMIEERTTVYLCRDYSCEAPVGEPEKFRELLKDFPGYAR